MYLYAGYLVDSNIKIEGFTYDRYKT